MLMPANVAPLKSFVFVVSRAAPLGNTSVAVPVVAGGAPPDQFGPVDQLLFAPAPVHVHVVQPPRSATAMLTIFPLPENVPLNDVAVPCAEPWTRYAAAIVLPDEPTVEVLPYSSVKLAGKVVNVVFAD